MAKELPGFLSKLHELIDHGSQEFYPSTQDGEIRRASEGILTLTATIGGRQVGIVYHDFKLNGGSYSIQSSQRLYNFVQEMKYAGNPIVMFINTLGVNISEGRRVFDRAFRVVAGVKSFVETNLLITVNIGRCLGLGAIIYSMGDYRFCLGESSQLNLAGPEIIKMFFGNEVDYSAFSSPEVQMDNGLVHETESNSEIVFDKIKTLLNLSLVGRKEVDTGLDEYKKILDNISPDRVELFEQLDRRVLVYLMKINDRVVGVLANPLGKGNLFTKETLAKYRLALNLFKKLNLPLVSLVDTAGIDPRLEENAKGMLQELVGLAADLMDYPFMKLGIVIGRSFGGASIVAIPTFFGGESSLILKGARIGIMSSQIIKVLLQHNKRMLENYNRASAEETEDAKDLIEAGLVDRIVALDELAFAISLKLDPFYIQNPNTVQSLFGVS